jgi:hypothetical protein
MCSSATWQETRETLELERARYRDLEFSNPDLLRLVEADMVDTISIRDLLTLEDPNLRIANMRLEILELDIYSKEYVESIRRTGSMYLHHNLLTEFRIGERSLPLFAEAAGEFDPLETDDFAARLAGLGIELDDLPPMEDLLRDEEGIQGLGTVNVEDDPLIIHRILRDKPRNIVFINTDDRKLCKEIALTIPALRVVRIPAGFAPEDEKMVPLYEKHFIKYSMEMGYVILEPMYIDHGSVEAARLKRAGAGYAVSIPEGVKVKSFRFWKPKKRLDIQLPGGRFIEVFVRRRGRQEVYREFVDRKGRLILVKEAN